MFGYRTPRRHLTAQDWILTVACVLCGTGAVLMAWQGLVLLYGGNG